MIPMGFVLDNLIIFLKTFVGLVIAFSSLIFFEYLIFKSIMDDPNRINLKMILNYLKKYQSKNLSQASVGSYASNSGQYQEPITSEAKTKTLSISWINN